MQDRLKVAQLVPYYSPIIGGVEVVCQYVSEELVRRGHEVHVFTANRSHKGSPQLRLAADELINGVNVHRFKSYLNVGHYGFFPGFISPLMRGGFDVIHAHGYRQPQSEIGSRVGARLNIPTILHVHGGFFTHSSVKRAFYDLFDWFARNGRANLFDHYIALSEMDRARLLELNIDRGCISIIRNAAENQAFENVEPQRFVEKYDLTGKRVILYLSILHHYKRPDLLIRALPRLIEREPEVFLLLVGPDAGELEKINALGRELGVTRHFKWIGALRGKEKHEAFECSEFLALPSDEDPYPLVLLEAMAHRKPVLTTSVVGQAPLVESHGAGIVVQPGDLNGLIEGALRLLSDPSLKSSIAGNARRLAEQMFSAKAVVDEIEALYWRLLEKKHASDRGNGDSRS